MKLKILLFYILLFSSCTSHRIYTGNKAFESTFLSLDTVTALSVKKADVHLNTRDFKTRFKISLKIRKDDFIQISLLAPMGFEVMRIFMTPDKLSYINFHEKSYYSGVYPDYGVFSSGFDFLQSVFLNRFQTVSGKFPVNIVSDNVYQKITYSNFIENDEFMYPMKTDIKFKSDRFLNSLRFEFANVVLGKEIVSSFKIPLHYRKIDTFSYSGF